MKRLLPSLRLADALAGCGMAETLGEGFEHSQQVAKARGRAVGAKPSVGFNWRNGAPSDVTVAFDGIPHGRGTEEIGALSRAAIATRFKRKPRQAVISYALPGTPRPIAGDGGVGSSGA
ncbi:hypothetical protein [Vulcaniibacterium tengchongense]|uniref:Uncharacterized protein n=1 Tax=Vulcaniibacterium tengchongense TaxID=1273429 RepID=A0A3N4VF71_9GAMM|nr:hypothetical protein [Vulcaniibacterium tengchongense]RPE80155.1 hypothetical protein EDC50_1987 [Vulcaniibacterium tengchongense]